jgi:hypothetical protein
MNDLENRIKIAEAMGWVFKEVVHTGFSGRQVTRKQWFTPLGVTYSGIRLPDPFTDANADYDVLEFMRNQGRGLYDEYCNALAVVLDNDHFNYAIGDYARAALVEIDKGEAA